MTGTRVIITRKVPMRIRLVLQKECSVSHGVDPGVPAPRIAVRQDDFGMFRPAAKTIWVSGCCCHNNFSWESCRLVHFPFFMLWYFPFAQGEQGIAFHELCDSPVNDEILLKQGQTRLASLACVSPCFNKISEQTRFASLACVSPCFNKISEQIIR